MHTMKCAALVTLICATLAGCVTAPNALPIRSAASLRAAAVGLEDLNGQPVDLSRWSGHPMVLAFLGPNNGDSQADVPLLLRLSAAYASQGLVVVAVGENASVAALRAFDSSAGLTFPLLQDPGAGVWSQRGFATVPAFDFIDAQGQVQSSQQGFLSRGQLTAGIEALVGGDTAGAARAQ